MAAEPRVADVPVSLAQELERIRVEIDELLGGLLAVPPDPRARLYEAMRHAALAGGKRLRPLLVVAACGLFHIARDRALRVAAAVECVHV